MVSQERAEETLEQAHDFANWEPSEQILEFFLAKEETVQPEDDDSEPEEELVIRELPFHHEINIKLNSLFLESLFKVVSKTIRNERVPLKEYQATNIEEDPRPIQYLHVDDIPDYDVFDPFTRSTGFEETSVNDFNSADFQALRLRDGLGNMFVAYRKFTRNQIVGSSWKVKVSLSDSEYDEFEEDVFALPENIDAFVYDDILYVVNQGKFEDIFNFFESYRTKADNVFEGIRESDLTIYNHEEFEEAVLNDRYALRKMVQIEERAIWEDENFNQDNIERVIDDYNLEVNVSDDREDWGIVMPRKNAKGDILRLLNDDHVVSDITSERYQARSKREI